MARTNIWNVIKKDLKAKVKKKRLVHSLNAHHKSNRKTNSRKLYERHLGGQKSEHVVTLDEAIIELQDFNTTRRIYYRKPNQEDLNLVSQKKEKFRPRFMVVGAITGRGVLPLVKVPPNVKINSQYYIESVLKPLLEDSLPKLYPGELHKIFVHHDKASSHTSRRTAQYATDLKNRLGISIISNEEIPVKSPDASPFHFYGFGYLKQRIHHRKATTLDGAWKLLKEEWNKVTPETVKKVFDSWKRRLRMIARSNGEHVEQTKAIHKRKL